MFYPIINLNEFKRNSGQSIHFHIIQVGCGGSGGYLAQRLSKLLHSLYEQGKAIPYTLIDGDTVEESNLLRQPFIDEDLSQPKAETLAARYQDIYGISIFFKNEYIEKESDIIDCTFFDNQWYRFNIPIVIGMVDNNATRQIMHQAFMDAHNMIYIDAGNDGIDLSEPLENQKTAGYSGQVVVGVKMNGKVCADPVGLVYTDILEDKDSRLPTQACGESVVYSPQRMQTNETSALVTMSYLNNILCEHEIVSHYTNFNARTSLIKPTYFKSIDKKVI